VTGGEQLHIISIVAVVVVVGVFLKTTVEKSCVTSGSGE
jgi:hypothetical protein